MKNFTKIFEEISNDLSKKILQALRKASTKSDYKTIWNHFQEIVSPIVKKELLSNIDDLIEENINITSSKSTYPDIEVNYHGKKFAIDVKSNEEEKQPWYDIARLDSIKEKRLDIFDEEYDIIIKYSSSTNVIKAVYVEPMYKTVGIRGECNGVKYRPYDGKLRPKSWKMFEKGETYWKTKEEFVEGINKSKINRREELIKEWELDFDTDFFVKFIERWLKKIPEDKKKKIFKKFFQ